MEIQGIQIKQNNIFKHLQEKYQKLEQTQIIQKKCQHLANKLNEIKLQKMNIIKKTLFVYIQYLNIFIQNSIKRYEGAIKVLISNIMITYAAIDSGAMNVEIDKYSKLWMINQKAKIYQQ
ncbi:unnamed protein product [Paramecium pentaurelia]|uniref:Uncharacterized protein n=1 Tax=Paramecium pentaurelia TaxID=43138 RepID=A0A8S1TH52_9CILI|nr:unnamed protein product [Paramecium pentaurelia]